jgi:hypothetical protein
MSEARRRVPTEAEWQRLNVVFGTFTLITVVVAFVFITSSPFPQLIGLGLMAPIVGPTAWIYIMVIRRRDLNRLDQLSAYALRRRERKRRGR